MWALLTEWLAVRGEEGVPNVFCVVRKGENLDVSTPLTGNSIYQILRRCGTAAGVADFSPHEMRRTFATRMFEDGAAINIVRQAMGHRSVVTTPRYAKRSEKEVRRFAAKVKIQFLDYRV